MAEQPFHTRVVQAVALVRHALHDARLAEPSAAARMLVLPPHVAAHVVRQELGSALFSLRYW